MDMATAGTMAIEAVVTTAVEVQVITEVAAPMAVGDPTAVIGNWRKVRALA
jgi:hypothetical protein